MGMLSMKEKIILVTIMMSKTIFIKIIVVRITGRKNGVGTAQCRGLAWQSFGIEKLAFFIIGNINILTCIEMRRRMVMMVTVQ